MKDDPIKKEIDRYLSIVEKKEEKEKFGIMIGFDRSYLVGLIEALLKRIRKLEGWRDDVA